MALSTLVIPPVAPGDALPTSTWTRVIGPGADDVEFAENKCNREAEYFFNADMHGERALGFGWKAAILTQVKISDHFRFIIIVLKFNIL